MHMTNVNFATTVALLIWPAVALWLFKTRPIGTAILWTILGGYLLLPVGTYIKFQMIPPFDKSSVPNFAALFGCIFVCGKSLRFSKGFGIAELLVATLLITPFITCELNGDPIALGNRPGLGLYDAGSAAVAQIETLIPFFLGRQFLGRRNDIEDILRVLIIAGLVYSVPSIFEIRFSPQLHTWIYGYFPHEFGQQMRDGGFRPVVFLGHGLLVAFFISTSAVAAAAFWRTGTQVFQTIRLRASAVTSYLSILLVLCKTASALLYGAVLVFLVYFTRPKIQLSIAVLLTSFALLYPILRSADLVPTDAAITLANDWFDSDRVSSFKARLVNENALLERASQRFFFGWGSFSRGFIYDDYDNLVYAPDGTWVITIGEYGFVGFLALFGLLSLPVFAAARAVKFGETPKDKLFLSALALIVAVNIFDLLPNSSVRPWTWLVAGALLSRSEALRQQARFPKILKMGLAISPPK